MIESDKTTSFQLIELRTNIIEGLREGDVVRTRNHPLGDFTKWLVVEEMGLKLEKNSRTAYDATGSDGTRYQIKGRQVFGDTRWQLEVPEQSRGQFDYVVFVKFDGNLRVLEALQIPADLFFTYGKRKRGKYIVNQSSDLFSDDRVEDISDDVR